MSTEHYKYYRGTSAVLPDGDVLACGPLTRDMARLPQQALRAASYCTTFDTPAGHAARLTAVPPFRRLAADRLGALLEQAAQAGVLTSNARVREIVANGFTQTADRPTIQTIAIPTRDRPQTLCRLLADLGRHMEEHGRAASVLIIDNSESAEVQQANRRVSADAARAIPAGVTCVTRDDRRRFAARLARETGLPEALTSFALLGQGYATTIGACRNAVLLGRSGQVVLFMDDDVRCRVARVPHANEDITFDPLAAGGRFFATHDDLERCDFLEPDLLGVHERALSIDRRVIEARLSGASPSDLSGITLAFLQKLARAPVRVRVSCLGLIGDAATSDPLHYYLHGAGTFAQLAQSDAFYRATLESRLLLRGSTGLLVTEAFDGMSYCMAADNRTPLPPFMPAHSGEEQIFGTLVACMPGAAFAATPLAILHEPAERRRFAEGAAARRAGRFTLNDTLTLMLRAETPHGATLDEVLRSLGTRLQEIAALPERDLREHARRVITPIVMGYVQRLEQLLADGPASSTFWRPDVEQLIARCLWSLQHQDHAVPLDLEDLSGSADAPRRLRHALADLGRLLCSWIAMVDGAARLTAADDGILVNRLDASWS